MRGRACVAFCLCLVVVVVVAAGGDVGDDGDYDDVEQLIRERSRTSSSSSARRNAFGRWKAVDRGEVLAGHTRHKPLTHAGNALALPERGVSADKQRAPNAPDDLSAANSHVSRDFRDGARIAPPASVPSSLQPVSLRTHKRAPQIRMRSEVLRSARRASSGYDARSEVHMRDKHKKHFPAHKLETIPPRPLAPPTVVGSVPSMPAAHTPTPAATPAAAQSPVKIATPDSVLSHSEQTLRSTAAWREWLRGRRDEAFARLEARA